MITQFLSKRLMGSLLRLQIWDIEYFRHLMAEWNNLNVPANDPDAIRIAALTSDFLDPAKCSLIHRGHLLEFEQTLLRHRTADALIQQAPMLRLRYRDIVGERQYAAYKETKLPTCGPLDEASRLTLLEDLSNLLGSIHWRYILAPFRDKERTALTITALIWMGIYTIAWVVLVFHFATGNRNPFLAVFVTVLFAGILGGFISALRRMQSINDDTDSVFVIQGIAGANFWLWFSPLLGAVFAVVAYLFFVSGLVEGVVFPDFRTPSVAFPDLVHSSWWFWHNLVPKTQQDYAKLFLWCFISGFAERFIPDMIDRIIQRGQGAQKNIPVSSPQVVIAPTPVEPEQPITQPTIKPVAQPVVQPDSGNTDKNP
jgi:hypothetical protein